MRFGLNLFSIRSLIKEDQYLETTLKLKQMGYEYVQYSGAPFNATLIKNVQEKTGLKVVLTHVPMLDILENTQRLIDEHNAFGCKNIGLGMMPLDIIKDEKKCLETIDKLNEAGKYMTSQGSKLFYHFHHFEFLKLSNGQMIIDYMIDNCPYINFTADTYWIQFGGVDVNEYLMKMKGRIECIHLKDYRIIVNNNGELIPAFAPLGSGNLNISKIIETAKEAGCQYFLVEQDDAVNYPDPLEQIKTSIDYLKQKFI